MSASNKKKLRKEEKMAKLTERQQAELKEAKKLKTNTIIFVVAIALVLAIGIGMMVSSWFKSSGLSDRMTTAVQIGSHKLSVADLNYYYVDMLNELSQDWYSMYLLQLEDGFDSTKAMDEQLYHGEAGKTWGDYFVDRAIEEASGILALVDDAKAKGYTLSESEKTDIEDTLVAMETQGWLYGFTELDDYLQAIYGNGAQEKSYRAYVENLTLAQSYYNNYTEALSYTDEEITKYETEAGSYSAFDYIYFHVDPEDFMTHEGEEADDEHEHTDAEKEAALKQAKEVADALAASGAKNEEELNKAIASLEVYNPNAGEEATTEEPETQDPTTEDANDETTPAETTPEETVPATTEGTTPATTEGTAPEETEPEATEPEATEPEATEPEDEPETPSVKVPTCTKQTAHEYAYINSAIGKWLISGAHKEGDIAAVPYYAQDEEGNDTETVESYYVVIFGSEDKHEEKTLAVRHILKNYEGGTTDENSGETVYSDEEKKAAEDEINKIKAEWEAGAKTAESFGELAKTHTDDSNGDEGGLYPDVYPGWAVEEFDAWCFDESRKAGDVGVVHTEYGCHLIYFQGVNETTYREYMITTDMRAEDSEAWYTGLRDNHKNAAKVGNTSGINTSIILSK